MGMRLLVSQLLILGPLAVERAAEGASVKAQHAWPQWRGPLGSGVAPNAQPPIEWSQSTSHDSFSLQKQQICN